MQRIISLIISFVFVFNSLLSGSSLWAAEVSLPTPARIQAKTISTSLPVLQGIKVNPNDPFAFDFVVNPDPMRRQPGDSSAVKVKAPQGNNQPLNEQELKNQSMKLIKYFLASLTIPEDELWVNLSPYEKGRIVPESFGQTEMGRDLLAQDYLLKQATSNLMHPDSETGKAFWKRVYEKAAAAGLKNIPVSTYNKVWIMPDKATVYENPKVQAAYVVESSLKVMLEEDYLSKQKNLRLPGDRSAKAGGSEVFALPAAPGEDAERKAPPRGDGWGEDKVNSSLTGPASSATQIIREIIIPELTKEVNTSASFAQLRQVYNSLILATWYKKKIKESILARVYIDQKKIKGLEPVGSVSERQPGDRSAKAGGSEVFSLPAAPGEDAERKAPPRGDGWGEDKVKTSLTGPASLDDVEFIYQRYLKAFKKGAYNLIKEEHDLISGQTIPRKYFSGGMAIKVDPEFTNDVAMMTRVNPGSLPEIKVEVLPESTNVELMAKEYLDKMQSWKPNKEFVYPSQDPANTINHDIAAVLVNNKPAAIVAEVKNDSLQQHLLKMVQAKGLFFKIVHYQMHGKQHKRLIIADTFQRGKAIEQKLRSIAENPENDEFHRDLGRLLGYPIKAIDRFIALRIIGIDDAMVVSKEEKYRVRQLQRIKSNSDRLDFDGIPLSEVSEVKEMYILKSITESRDKIGLTPAQMAVIETYMYLKGEKINPTLRRMRQQKPLTEFALIKDEKEREKEEGRRIDQIIKEELPLVLNGITSISLVDSEFADELEDFEWSRYSKPDDLIKFAQRSDVISEERFVKALVADTHADPEKVREKLKKIFGDELQWKSRFMHWFRQAREKRKVPLEIAGYEIYFLKNEYTELLEDKENRKRILKPIETLIGMIDSTYKSYGHRRVPDHVVAKDVYRVRISGRPKLRMAVRYFDHKLVIIMLELTRETKRNESGSGDVKPEIKEYWESYSASEEVVKGKKTYKHKGIKSFEDIKNLVERMMVDDAMLGQTFVEWSKGMRSAIGLGLPYSTSLGEDDQKKLHEALRIQINGLLSNTPLSNAVGKINIEPISLDTKGNVDIKIKLNSQREPMIQIKLNIAERSIESFQILGNEDLRKNFGMQIIALFVVAINDALKLAGIMGKNERLNLLKTSLEQGNLLGGEKFFKDLRDTWSDNKTAVIFGSNRRKYFQINLRQMVWSKVMASLSISMVPAIKFLDRQSFLARNGEALELRHSTSFGIDRFDIVLKKSGESIGFFTVSPIDPKKGYLADGVMNITLGVITLRSDFRRQGIYTRILRMLPKESLINITHVQNKETILKLAENLITQPNAASVLSSEEMRKLRGFISNKDFDPTIFNVFKGYQEKLKEKKLITLENMFESTVLGRGLINAGIDIQEIFFTQGNGAWIMHVAAKSDQAAVVSEDRQRLRKIFDEYTFSSKDGRDGFKLVFESNPLTDKFIILEASSGDSEKQPVGHFFLRPYGKAKKYFNGDRLSIVLESIFLKRFQNSGILSAILKKLPKNTVIKIEDILEVNTIRKLMKDVIAQSTANNLLSEQDIRQLNRYIELPNEALELMGNKAGIFAIFQQYKEVQKRKGKGETLTAIFHQTLLGRALISGGFRLNEVSIRMRSSFGIEEVILDVIAIKDAASVARDQPFGGIDFDPKNIDLKAVKDQAANAQGVNAGHFYVDPALIEEFSKAQGFAPRIVSFSPSIDIKDFLGITTHP